MTGWLSKTTIVIAIAFAALAVTVPSVQARMWASPAGASGLAQIQEPGSVSDFDTYDFEEPTGVYDVGLPEQTGAAGGVSWGAVAIGAAFASGLWLVASGARLGLRRRALARQSHA